MKLKYILCLLLTILIYPVISKNVFAHDRENYEPKIYCELSTDDNFSLNSVLVLMDKSISDVNKVFDKSFFGNIDILEVVDLTYRTDWNSITDKKKEDFRQILELQLKPLARDGIIDTIRSLEKIDGIVCASPNYIGSSGAMLNDTYFYEYQWGLNGENGINIEQAWKFCVGTRNVRVGILDSGITPHEDLNDNLVEGFSYIDSNTNDYGIHGSHVAGIVGAAGNSIGISGVCRNVSLVPLKFDGDIGDIVAALTDAEENNIKIVNMSWWKFSDNVILKNAINDFDGLFVCIAGNGDTNIDVIPNYPASYHLENMIVVGAIKSDGDRPGLSDWGYDDKDRPKGSNYGESTVDIYAPGDDIYSTIPNDDYAYMYGTSMAAPYVTGVAALLLSIDPNLTITQLKDIILNSAEIITITIPDGTTQIVKKLNAYNAVKYILRNYSNSAILEYNNQYFSKDVDSAHTYFIENNLFLKLIIKNEYEYEFLISSNNLNGELEVVLYDSNFNEINISLTPTNPWRIRSFSQNLSIGTYYLSVNYVDTNYLGTIDVSINGEPHIHLYGEPYLWLDSINHNSSCECGASRIEGHAVLVGSKICIKCGGRADMGFEGLKLNSSTNLITNNGSCLLLNGVIVLVKEDLESYLNGTLIFYNKNSFNIDK